MELLEGTIIYILLFQCETFLLKKLSMNQVLQYEYLGSLSSKILFPKALSNTQAISNERLSNWRLVNSSLKVKILLGDALFLVILNSLKSVSSSPSKTSTFSGYSILLLLSDLTWSIVPVTSWIVWPPVTVSVFHQSYQLLCE